jgi:integrase
VATGAKTLEEAFSFLQKCVQYEAEKRSAEERKKEHITFCEFAKEFMEGYMIIEREGWKSDSYRLDIAIDYFNETPLKEITAQQVRNFKQLRIEAGNRGGTVNRYLALLKKLFNVAIEKELISKNPVKPVKFMSEQNTVVERILTDEEEQRLLEECSERLRPVVVIALHTGLRQGELLNIMWKNVSFLSETVTVENTKNGKSRVIPMNGIAKAELMRLYETRVSRDKVFPFTSIRTAWENARKRAGLEDLRFHDLRHTFATRLVQTGADIVEVQKLLGHSTLLVTQRYTHACEDRLRRAVKMLDVQPNNEKACSNLCSKNIEQPSEDSFTSLESVN